MSHLDTFRAMTAADVMEAIAEDPSVLHAWQAEIGKLDRRRLDAVEQFAQAEVAGAHFKAEAARRVPCGPDGGPLRLVVVPSSQLRDVLSLRPADAEGQPSGHLKHELRDAGFAPGDVVEVVLVRRAPSGGTP